MVPFADAADRPSRLAEVPVEQMTVVPPSDYREASALAARGSAPLEVALKIVGPFEGAAQQLTQVNEGSEAPSTVRVTVTRDGLLDDSVRGERWDIVLHRTAKGAWAIGEVRRAWRCWRGSQPDSFATVRCL